MQQYPNHNFEGREISSIRLFPAGEKNYALYFVYDDDSMKRCGLLCRGSLMFVDESMEQSHITSTMAHATGWYGAIPEEGILIGPEKTRTACMVSLITCCIGDIYTQEHIDVARKLVEDWEREKNL